MKNKIIDIDTAVIMFMAISYLQENRVIDLYVFRDYLFDSFARSNEFLSQEELIDFEDEYYRIMNIYVEDGLLDEVEGHKRLYRVNNCINYKYIIENNSEIYKDMVEFFYRFVEKSIPNVTVLPRFKIKQDKK